MFQELYPQPTLHVIIEPHPDVLCRMQQRGWYAKPGVKVMEGRWQDFIGTDDLLGIGGFDIVYTDTFAEDYNGGLFARFSASAEGLLSFTMQALHEFFGHLPDLLAGPESRFSFFNGLGATSVSLHRSFLNQS